MMQPGRKAADRQGEPISVGPTVDLIKRAAALTGEPRWRIRWDGARKYSRMRFAIMLVAFDGGVSVQGIGRVFEMDHSSVCYGKDWAIRRMNVDEEFARLVEALHAIWKEIKAEAEKRTAALEARAVPVSGFVEVGEVTLEQARYILAWNYGFAPAPRGDGATAHRSDGDA